MPLTALGINCTLKPSPAASSCEKLLGQVAEELRRLGVTCDLVRAVDHAIAPGVTSDEGPGDEWPALRRRVLAADILILGTPIWLGHPSSVCQRVLERMDAFLGELDDGGRMAPYGRVAGVAVVGNEDGAHHVSAELFQALNDVGFTLPASAVTYWVGEAMHKTDFQDLPATPKKTAQATRELALNCVHLARLLQASPYPPRE
ncbi:MULTISPECIES: flavodoxin family protein [Bordetella]|uniref:NADPH-dependent oxidoreductase n=2 Tax=Bordetella TaxID=517 RepID=A0A261VXM4_9BORD|nr:MULTISPECIES: NAD(P)H-dependent oxidoreductase [Bordetella]MDM9560274.1 NAD(P)H-dependent oxidoreductase [Bordetella petrii]OZI78360.1 NADPH-dependent oxidoreductase [Bordetella genomosp. 2]